MVWNCGYEGTYLVQSIKKKVSFSLGKTAVVRIGMGWDGMGRRKMLLLLRLQRGRSVGNKLSGCSERALLVLEGTGNKVVVHVVSRRYGIGTGTGTRYM